MGCICNMKELQNYLLTVVKDRKADKSLVKEIGHIISLYKEFLSMYKKDDTWFTKTLGICGTGVLTHKYYTNCLNNYIKCLDTFVKTIGKGEIKEELLEDKLYEDNQHIDNVLKKSFYHLRTYQKCMSFLNNLFEKVLYDEMVINEVNNKCISEFKNILQKHCYKYELKQYSINNRTYDSLDLFNNELSESKDASNFKAILKGDLALCKLVYETIKEITKLPDKLYQDFESKVN